MNNFDKQVGNLADYSSGSSGAVHMNNNTEDPDNLLGALI